MQSCLPETFTSFDIAFAWKRVFANSMPKMPIKIYVSTIKDALFYIFKLISLLTTSFFSCCCRRPCESSPSVCGQTSSTRPWASGRAPHAANWWPRSSQSTGCVTGMRTSSTSPWRSQLRGMIGDHAPLKVQDEAQGCDPLLPHHGGLS